MVPGCQASDRSSSLCFDICERDTTGYFQGDPGKCFRPCFSKPQWSASLCLDITRPLPQSSQKITLKLISEKKRGKVATQMYNADSGGLRMFEGQGRRHAGSRDTGHFNIVCPLRGHPRGHLINHGGIQKGIIRCVYLSVGAPRERSLFQTTTSLAV